MTLTLLTTLMIAPVHADAAPPEGDVSELDLPDDLVLTADLDAEEPSPDFAIEMPVRPQSPGGFKLPVVRTELRVGMRQRTNPSATFELGTQLLEGKRVTLEGGLAYGFGRVLGINGALRTMSSVETMADLQWTADRWLTVGPSVGMAARFFHQDFQPVNALLMPMVGARATLGIIGARTWRMSLTSRINVDVNRTTLVLDTAEVVTMDRVELQLGMRWAFGQGIPPVGDL